MEQAFLRFKKKLFLIRFLRSLLWGLSAGLLFSAVVLWLLKTDSLKAEKYLSVLVGITAFAVTFTVCFFAFRISKKQLAVKLDRDLALKERAETMLAFLADDSAMANLQRQDAKEKLQSADIKALKTARLWIPFVVLFVSVSLMLVSIFVIKEKVEEIPKNEPIPFEISEVQIAGIEELIRYVDSSEMTEEYKTKISSELTLLLANLKEAKTEPEMQAALASSVTYITELTYDSSSMTEILNELWLTEDEHIRLLAQALNTSSWTEPDWGDFAEKYSTLKKSFVYLPAEGEEPYTDEELLQKIKWELENCSLKINMALSSSNIAKEDPLYSSINKLVNIDGTEGEGCYSLNSLSKASEQLDYAKISTELDSTLSAMSGELYSVISQQKINTNVGEYTLKKLCALFSIPTPAFERPDFVKNGEGGNKPSDDERPDENGPSDGGLGEGAVFGSKDLVLDPLTGKLVEYGTLVDKYYAIMNEKIENGSYTKEQIEAIIAYFDLLYGGFDKKD